MKYTVREVVDALHAEAMLSRGPLAELLELIEARVERERWQKKLDQHFEATKSSDPKVREAALHQIARPGDPFPKWEKAFDRYNKAAEKLLNARLEQRRR